MEYKICRCENPEALVEAITHASPAVGIVVHFRTGNERGVIVSVSVARAVPRGDGGIAFEGKTPDRGAEVKGYYSLDQRSGKLVISSDTFSMPPLTA